MRVIWLMAITTKYTPNPSTPKSTVQMAEKTRACTGLHASLITSLPSRYGLPIAVPKVPQNARIQPRSRRSAHNSPSCFVIRSSTPTVGSTSITSISIPRPHLTHTNARGSRCPCSSVP